MPAQRSRPIQYTTVRPHVNMPCHIELLLLGDYENRVHHEPNEEWLLISGPLNYAI
jgi:hypothetical protein